MFDQILENRIKMGKFQYKTTAILGLIDFIDGGEYVFLSILISILKNEWDLTNNQISFLASIYFCGMIVGNVLCALYADIIGRKNSLSFFMALQCFVVIYTAFIYTVFEMCIIRFFYGMIFGFTLPLCHTVVSEIAEARYRGRFSLVINIMYVLGKIYCVLLCFYFLNDYTSGNWRGLILFNTIPVFFCFLFSFISLKESPRYLIIHQKFSKAFKTINEVGYENNGLLWQRLSNEEKDQLVFWQQKYFSQEYQELSFTELFNSQYRESTIKLWILIICWNFQNSIPYLLLPFLFQETKESFFPLLYIFIGELVMAIIVFMFVDNVEYGGRKNILISCAFSLLALNVAIVYFQHTYLVILITLFKFFIRSKYIIIMILACESYSSIYRTKGASTIYCVGKIAAAIAPYFIFPLYFYNSFYPFILCIVLSFLFIFASITFPLELTQQRLDNFEGSGKQYTQK